MNKNITPNKVGIYYKAFDYLPTHEDRFKRLSDLGFDSVDISFADTDTSKYYHVEKMEEQCAHIRSVAKKYKVTISQVHGPWPTDDDTEEGRKWGWECMHKAVYGTYLLGAKYLVIHPQMPFGADRDDDPDFAEQMTVDLLRELIPDCEKYGVTVCLENMPFRNQRISTVKNIVRAVEKVNSRYVGICFDTGHCNCMGDDVAEAVRLAAPYLKVFHIHDNNMNTFDAHLLPGMGNIDWISFSEAVADIGFDGTLSLETGCPKLCFMDESAIEANESLAYAVADRLRALVLGFKQKNAE